MLFGNTFGNIASVTGALQAPLRAASFGDEVSRWATASVLMPLTPGYGDTPLSDEELEALLPHIDLMEQPVRKAPI